MKKIIYTLLSIFLLISCDNLQTVIEVDLPEHEPKLVVNSINQVGQKWKAYVSVSQAPLSNSDFVFLTDATVLIMDGDNVVDTLKYIESEFCYKSDVIVQQGADFQIRVSHPMYETVSAGLYSFEKIKIKSVDDIQSASNGYGNLRFSFDDPAQTDNFYMISIDYYSKSSDGESYSLYIESDDPSIVEGYYADSKLLFDDKLFNGSTKEFNLLIDEYFSQSEDSIFLNLWSVDYAFYQYQSSLIIQSYSGDNPIFSAEPVNVYNSFLDENGLINGYGIFAVSDLDSVMIQFE